MRKPIVGVTLDYEEAGAYSQFPYYLLRKNYIDSFTQFGVVPLMLPSNIELIDDYLSLIDGLIITGGHFDIDPRYYGEQVSSNKVKIKEDRTKFEYAITQASIQKRLPILGICGGMQLLNVIFGGTMIQDILDEVPNAIDHEQKIPKDQPYHNINIITGSLLHNIVGVDSYKVNSTHHQAVKQVGEDMEISAKADDGIIEAIELKNYPFCLGVEWHPEYVNNPYDKLIFAKFVEFVKNHGK